MSSQVTLLLAQVSDGHKEAKDQLLRVVYDELRQKAAHYMSHQRHDHTLQPTALVHEAYVKLIGSEGPAFQSRAHFFHAAAQAMRQILVEHARAKGSEKRGGGLKRIDLQDVDLPTNQIESDADFELLDLAMKKLESLDKRRHEVVMLRYFAGQEIKDIAAMLGVSEKTVQRDWETAGIVLKAELRRMNG